MSPDRSALKARSLARHAARLSHDEELRRARPLPEVTARLAACASSLACVTTACAAYAERPALGERAVLVEDGVVRPLPRFQTITYAELGARVRGLAAGLRRAGLAAPGDRLVICGFAGIEWVVADLACVFLSAISVPLQTRMPPEDLRAILAETSPRAALVSLDEVEAVSSAIAPGSSVETIMVMDLRPEEQAAEDGYAQAAEAVRRDHRGRVGVLRFAEMLGEDDEVEALPAAEARRGEADPLMTLIYTSGSTGTPKGAMFPESLLAELWRKPWSEDGEEVAHVGVGYMPLAHAAGRFEVIRALATGGLTCFPLASDMSTLFEDIRLVRPTRLMFVPRVSAMIHQDYLAERVRRTRGVAGEAARARIEEELVLEMRGSTLGDRLVSGLAGSAPTAPEILAFLERCFDVPVIDTYGSTEAGLISRDGKLVRGEVLAYELRSVPELGYTTNDAPHPRGELLVKTRRLVPGYFRNPEASRELFDERGFLRTGDVVELRGKDEIAWIDRVKNVLKLAQGEFVSTAKLEGLYAARSPFIRQIHVHGSSARAYLLAVVVPDGRAVEARLGAAPAEGAVTELLRGEIERIAGEASLPGWEVPRGILVEPEPFTRENGLLTASNKPSRPRFKERYGARLEAMYEAIEARQVERLGELDEQAEDAPVAARVALAMGVVLGLDEVDLGRSFPELGGDSIAAARLAEVLEERLGVEVPVGMLLDGTTTGRDLVAHVERRLAGARTVSFAEVHGAGAATVRAEDLRLDRFLDAEVLGGGRTAPASAPRAVLLTGASGFLGRFLLLALLERLPREGRVTCLVRGRSDAAAEARLAGVFRSDARLAERLRDLAAGGRLVVRAGDLMRPRLGLGEDVFARLSEEIDAVVHDGALVNHALSYPQLFQPNVAGTAEVIRLALTARAKSVAYVSTVGVAGGLARLDAIREDEGARALFEERPIDHGYAVGYATSKWAGEVLMGELSARFGVPTAIFRCSMIMPPREGIGQVNAGDFFIRLLVGVIATGLAPRSFYAPGVGEHFDGLPVDFTAASIAAVALDPRPGSAVYHVVNPRWEEGVSLDTLVRWIGESGYAIRHVEEHARWYEAFVTELSALPPEVRARSPLPIVEQWARPLARGMRFDAARLRERLAALGAEAEMPALTRGYVEKVASDLAAAGLVARPLGRAA